MNLDNKKFSNLLQRLIEFKSGITKVPIRAESWEELIWATLVFMFGEEKVNWDPQSHEKSVDIKVKLNSNILKISAKAGEIKKGMIAISSYRLTTFNKLREMLQFIKEQHNSFDFYLICVREIKRNTITYHVIKTPSDKLAPRWLVTEDNWISTKHGHTLKDGLGFKANIVFKMSNQLWYSIPIDYFSPAEHIVNITIPLKELGKGLIEFLRNNIKK